MPPTRRGAWLASVAPAGAPTYAPVMQALWLTLLILATSVWLGGYVTIALVTRVAGATLAPDARVAFYRALGRTYLPVGAAALAVALLSGGFLAWPRLGEGLGTAAAGSASALVVVLAVAVAQARRMTRLQQARVAAPDDPVLTSRARRGGLTAGVLRALLGVLSLVAVVLGCLMAV